MQVNEELAWQTEQITSETLQTPTQDIDEGVNEENLTTEVPAKNLLTEKLNNERDANRNLFSLVQHRQNYLLPISYSTGPNPVTLDGVGEEQIDRFEAKYQISVKTPLWLQEDYASGVYFGFTAVSFWQLYNDETSKPFRETNYQPEVFYQFNTNISLAGYKFNLFRIGLNHMSNGQSGLKSRSWNRITATALFSDQNTAYFLRTWLRLPEEEKMSLLDPLGDDNPDINDYYGRVELGFGYRLGNLDITSSIRNNLSIDDNRSGVEINITYPFNKRYDVLVQYFNGYGDSLIDYNRHQQRFSIGMQIKFL
ncbi:MAG: phospholipase A1 [Alphaproteobacteria bacterium]|jgi:phospholipase A1